jgi:hypothetical protein
MIYSWHLYSIILFKFFYAKSWCEWNLFIYFSLTPLNCVLVVLTRPVWEKQLVLLWCKNLKKFNERRRTVIMKIENENGMNNFLRGLFSFISKNCKNSNCQFLEILLYYFQRLCDILNFQEIWKNLYVFQWNSTNVTELE